MCCFCSDCVRDILGPTPANDDTPAPRTLPGRRSILGGLAAATVASLAPAPASAQVQGEFRRQVMRLTIANRSTGENFDGVFWAHGRYIIGAVNQINQVLRDQRAGAVVQIDLPLLDLLERIQFGVRRPLAVFSGYRTFETNRALRASDPHVAENSFHIRGQAIDFAADGVPAARLAQVARRAGAGGIGTYTSSNFVHVDTGPQRTWTF
ncbi:MAG: YcbK family protein [Alphaproteobacteria bacterium]|nr:YcbK family protein [Alphaproteobacteria bacterium]